MPGFLVVLVTGLFLYSLLHTGERMSKKDGFSTNVNERYLNTQKELYPLPSLNLTPKYTVLSGWKSQISNAIHFHEWLLRVYYWWQSRFCMYLGIWQIELLRSDTINGRMRHLKHLYFSICMFKVCILLNIFIYTNYTILYN